MGKLEPEPELQSFQEDMDYDDEIEILEVVGLDEAGVPLETAYPAEDEEVTDASDVILDFDGAEGGGERPGEDRAAGDPPGAPDDDVARNDRDRLIRLHADFDNYKKRVEREQREYRRLASGELIRRLLPVLDNFERAVSAAADEEGEGNLRHGVILIFKQMLDEMRKEGLVAVDTVGLPFDPNVHEAVATDDNPELPPNTVVEEMQRGYLLHDRLLRPALVKVNMPEGDV